MNSEDAAAFASIESAQEYLGLLAETVLESRQAVQADLQAEADLKSPSYVEATRVIG